jgi:hypothetical protein
MPSLPVIKPIDTGDDYKLDIDYYLKHDYADIGEAAEKLPGIIEWLNEQRQIVKESMLRQKLRVRYLEAETSFVLKGGRFQELYPSEKITETAIGNAVQLDLQVGRAQEQLVVLIASVERLSTTILTLQIKLDMIRSTEATRRVLAQGEPSED